MFSFESITLAIYLPLVFFLSLLSCHRLYLALAALKRRQEPFDTTVDLPHVLVQLPIFNERYVVVRLIRAACTLDYPIDKMTIQVLDDSTDDTPAIAAPEIDKFARQGFNIHHVRRNNRQGFKAGALAHGLELCSAAFVAIFDADFLPKPNFLKELLPHFGDPSVGMVQARWDHLNRHTSALTAAQAVLLDGHFANEHGGRYVLGRFFNFNGTAGIWRRACISDAGGWSGRTLTEDLDLSYRAQLKGWRFIYRADITVPAELPHDVRAFKAQQHRWAKGAIETALLLLPTLWKKRGLALATKFEATSHLAGNIAYPLLLLMVLLLPFVLTVPSPSWLPWPEAFGWSFLAVSTCSLVSFYSLAEWRVGAARRTYLILPLVLALGIGLAVNNTRSVWQALRKKKSAFERTPKLGEKSLQQLSPGYSVRIDWQPVVEIFFGCYLLWAAWISIEHQQYLVTPFLSLFTLGFWLMGFGSFQNLPTKQSSADAFIDSTSQPNENLST